MSDTMYDMPLSDAWWLILAKIVAVFLFLTLMTLFVIVFERKLVARMQVRPGPNQVGPSGWLQSLTDGLKLPPLDLVVPIGPPAAQNSGIDGERSLDAVEKPL